MKQYEKPKLVVEQLDSTNTFCAISNAGKQLVFGDDGKGNYEDFSEFVN